MTSDLSAARAVETHVPGFHLGELIGRGGASRVWAAERLVDGARLAVKVTSPGRLHVGQLMELAAREIAVLDRVRHEHIIRLHEAHPLPDGSVAVVLDLADGGDLDTLVRARGRLPAGEVATMCTPLAGALAALHAAGVIHGDLSPRNVLFAADGRPLLGDFEAARLVGEGHPPLVAGTPGFLAPEVASGDIPTEASDIYGLGAIAWFAITGRALTPTVGAPGTEVRAPDLAEATALVGRGFAAVVCAMLAADPADRPRADQAAVWCYGAAVPEPVGLVTPGSAVGLRGDLSRVDPDSALTQRLRESAGHSTHSASPEPTSVRRRRTEHRAARRTRLLGGIRAWPVLT
ncbi:MAG: serine/threonine-protein kinase, partial [Candidatus Phosphoribacter sp.]